MKVLINDEIENNKKKLIEEDKQQVQNLISFWQNTLDEYRFIMNISTQALIEMTIKYLKDLLESK